MASCYTRLRFTINNPAGGLRHALKDAPPDSSDDDSVIMGDPHGINNLFLNNNYLNDLL